MAIRSREEAHVDGQSVYSLGEHRRRERFCGRWCDGGVRIVGQEDERERRSWNFDLASIGRRITVHGLHVEIATKTAVRREGGAECLSHECKRSADVSAKVSETEANLASPSEVLDIGNGGRTQILDPDRAWCRIVLTSPTSSDRDRDRVVRRARTVGDVVEKGELRRRAVLVDGVAVFHHPQVSSSELKEMQQ